MRKKRNYKRDRQPDLKYNSVLISRLVNYLMEDGKKVVAEKLMYEGLNPNQVDNTRLRGLVF